MDLPLVVKIENFAFGGSKIRNLKAENCLCIEDEAFVDEYNDVERNVLVECGKLDLENVKNCTKVDKIVNEE